MNIGNHVHCVSPLLILSFKHVTQIDVFAKRYYCFLVRNKLFNSRCFHQLDDATNQYQFVKIYSDKVCKLVDIEIFKQSANSYRKSDYIESVRNDTNGQ